MASIHQTLVCSVCQTRMSDMVRPRRLPCGDLVCEGCLTARFVSEEKSTACPKCEYGLEGAVVEDFPLEFGEAYSCDPCRKEGVTSKAELYCNQCSNRYCSAHVKVKINSCMFYCIRLCYLGSVILALSG